MGRNERWSLIVPLFVGATFLTDTALAQPKSNAPIAVICNGVYVFGVTSCPTPAPAPKPQPRVNPAPGIIQGVIPFLVPLLEKALEDHGRPESTPGVMTSPAAVVPAPKRSDCTILDWQSGTTTVVECSQTTGVIQFDPQPSAPALQSSELARAATEASRVNPQSPTDDATQWLIQWVADAVDRQLANDMRQTGPWGPEPRLYPAPLPPTTLADEKPALRPFWAPVSWPPAVVEPLIEWAKDIKQKFDDWIKDLDDARQRLKDPVNIDMDRR